MANQLYYDVFISIQGKTTGHGFATSLERAVIDKGFNTFIDENNLFNKGEEFALNVINKSRIAIIIFLENFAKYSLHEELPVIFNSFRQPNQPDRFLFPVFYNIDRSHVTTGAELIDRSEFKSEEEFDQYCTWKNVIFKVADIPGWYFKYGDGNEYDLIRGIVTDVYELCDGVPLNGAVRNEKPYRKFMNLWAHFWSSTKTQTLISDVVPHVSQTPQSVPDVSQTPPSVQDHVSLTVLEVNDVSQHRRHRVFQAEKAWKVVALISGFVGLLCYALSPSFDPLTRRWKPFSIIFYIVVCLVILVIIWFAEQASLFTRQSMNRLPLKACTTFAILIISPVYSYFYDKAVGEKPHILSVISNGMLTIMSFSLHKQTGLRVEIGVTTIFFGFFTIQMFTINWMLAFVPIIFALLLVVFSLNIPPRMEEDRELIS